MNAKEKSRELKKRTGAGILLMVVALFASAFNSGQFHERPILQAKAEQNTESYKFNVQDDNIEAEVVWPDKETEKPKFSEIFNEDNSIQKYIIIPKPDSKKRKATISDNYVYHTIFLDIEGDLINYYHPNMIERVAGEKKYLGVPQANNIEPYLQAYLNDKLTVGEEEESAYNEEIVKKEADMLDEDPLIFIKKTRVVGAMSGTRLAFTCNKIYVPELFEDEENYYITLKRPKDVYQKIVVLDAGHGGRHPGTLSFDGTIIEKDTTLKVILYLKELFDENKDIKIYYSRLNDATVYLRTRADLANQTEADFFVSIHNNAFKTKYAYGTEVWYNNSIQKKELPSSRLAEIILEKVTGVLGSRSRGIRDGSFNYVLGKTNMISALIEIGYLTNEEDLRYITNDTKMKECAKAIYDSILTAYKEMEE